LDAICRPRSCSLSPCAVSSFRPAPPPATSPLSLHDALPISLPRNPDHVAGASPRASVGRGRRLVGGLAAANRTEQPGGEERGSRDGPRDEPALPAVQPLLSRVVQRGSREVDPLVVPQDRRATT